MQCEEDEDGYAGCLRYLSDAHNATGRACGGVVSPFVFVTLSSRSSQVYAAYPYAAERDDELSFDGGDRIRVIEKDDSEKGWWR